jgi:hypothetical protein
MEPFMKITHLALLLSMLAATIPTATHATVPIESTTSNPEAHAISDGFIDNIPMMDDLSAPNQSQEEPSIAPATPATALESGTEKAPFSDEAAFDFTSEIPSADEVAQHQEAPAMDAAPADDTNPDTSYTLPDEAASADEEFFPIQAPDESVADASGIQEAEHFTPTK